MIRIIFLSIDVTLMHDDTLEIFFSMSLALSHTQLEENEQHEVRLLSTGVSPTLVPRLMGWSLGGEGGGR